MSTYFDINLDLTSEDKLVRDQAHDFAKEVMRPLSIELDKLPAEDVCAKGSPFWDFLKQVFELGYHKAYLPEVVGGTGLSPIQSHLFMEELFWGSVGLATCILLAGWPFLKVLETQDEKLIEEFVIPFCNCSDASMTGCWAITEPDHGSDALGARHEWFEDPKNVGQCQARLEGDEYVINGQKSAWVACAPFAAYCMLNVQLDRKKGLSGGGVCILPLDYPGVTRGKALEKVGQRDLPQGELFFDDVRIPKKWMFVEPETYEASVLGNMGFGNTGVSVFALGLARASFEEAFSYAKERIQGGKPLIEHYAMQIRLHQMFAKVEAMRAMSRAVWLLNNRAVPPVYEYAIAAKTFCTETAREVVDEAVQIHGANGLTKEYFVEKLWRDSRGLTIEDGETTVLNRVGGAILKETFPRQSVPTLW